MNTTIATILTIIVTNWVSIGEFKNNQGEKYDVLQGRRLTNTVACLEYQGTNRQFVLKSIEGPIVAEKKVQITNLYVTNIWLPKNFIITNGVITNLDNRTNYL